MLSLSYKDLRYVHGLVKKNSGEQGDYVLGQIEDIFRSIPPALIPLVLRKKHADILFLSAQSTVRQMIKYAERIDVQDKTMIVWCPNPTIMKYLTDKIASATKIRRDVLAFHKTVVFENGSKIIFYTSRQEGAMRGQSPDIVIMVQLDKEA